MRRDVQDADQRGFPRPLEPRRLLRPGALRNAAMIVGAALAVVGCSPTAAPTPSASAPVASTPSATPTPSETPAPTPTPSPTPTPTPTPTPAPTEAAAPAVDAGSAASLQVLVNKRTPLQPADYQPQLVSVSIAQDGDELVRPEADAALEQLSAAMLADIGEGVHVFSSYRSHARQASLYNGYVAQHGQAVADTTSARPGHSEHQTGLAVDVVGAGGACRLDVCFGGTAAGQWIAEHAWEHGFIVRYPDGLQGITGYHYEPWHLRFVGAETSAAMHAQGAATYEEFLGSGAAPDYGP
ncbi:M15 family metallopeptidase [Agrococcus sp. 1P02AA]|uniref:M15 family metallopeptidase n=1 Tax=Agrococcus sp. 1P02AA TaxID=3132259 RepID=UPI0039A64D89